MKFSKTVSVLMVGTALLAAGCQKKATEVQTPSLTEDQKAIYAFGVAIGEACRRALASACSDPGPTRSAARI